jgi:hypothetical protein
MVWALLMVWALQMLPGAGPSRRSSVHRASPALQDTEGSAPASPRAATAGAGMTASPRSSAARAVTAAATAAAAVAASAAGSAVAAAREGSAMSAVRQGLGPVSAASALDRVDRLFEREKKPIKVWVLLSTQVARARRGRPDLTHSLSVQCPPPLPFVSGIGLQPPCRVFRVRYAMACDGPINGPTCVFHPVPDPHTHSRAHAPHTHSFALVHASLCSHPAATGCVPALR